MKQVYGTWIVVQAEMKGQDVKYLFDTARLEISETGYKIYSSDTIVDSGILEFSDNSTDLDIHGKEGTNKDKLLRCLYKIENNQLIICYHLAHDGKRPEEFKASPENGYMLISYTKKESMKRVTGLGGIFFKSEDPKQLKSWYENHLGVTEVFKWIDLEKPEAKVPAQTIWSPFKKDTPYFSPSEKSFMFNFRVENLVELLKVLKEGGVQIVGEVEEYPYGKFGWIMDPEGNKIELWEPID